MRIGARAALWAAVAWLVSGCPAPGYRADRGGEREPPRGGEVERVLVLPLNLVAAMPRELAGGAGRVDQVLLDYLAERGRSVETMKFADALAAWREGDGDCRSETSKCDRFVRVAPFVARRLRASRDYDVLLVPYLLLRGARTNGAMASFDGVERPVETSGFAADGPYRLGGGRIRAASLKVYGFSADGKKLFDGIGGLDVVDRIDASGDRPYTVAVRNDVLGDPAMIREGVARALHRLVPRRDR